MAATILGSSMVFIDSTVVNIALPALQDALGATAADAQWIVESYALLFAAASALCGLAVDVGQLIAARGGTVVHVQDGFEKG